MITNFAYRAQRATTVTTLAGIAMITGFLDRAGGTATTFGSGRDRAGHHLGWRRGARNRGNRLHRSRCHAVPQPNSVSEVYGVDSRQPPDMTIHLSTTELESPDQAI